MLAIVVARCLKIQQTSMLDFQHTGKLKRQVVRILQHSMCWCRDPVVLIGWQTGRGGHSLLHRLGVLAAMRTMGDGTGRMALC